LRAYPAKKHEKEAQNRITIYLSDSIDNLHHNSQDIYGKCFCGRVHFPKEYVGEVLKMQDGQEFTVFRRLTVIAEGDNPNNLAVFKVRFRVKNLKPGANKWLSMICSGIDRRQFSYSSHIPEKRLALEKEVKR